MWHRIEKAIKHQIIADNLKEEARVEAAYGYYGTAAALEARGAVESARAVGASLNPFPAHKSPAHKRRQFCEAPVEYYYPVPTPVDVECVAVPQPQPLRQLALPAPPPPPQPQPQPHPVITQRICYTTPSVYQAQQPHPQPVAARAHASMTAYAQPSVPSGPAHVVAGYVYDYGAPGAYQAPY